MMLLLFIALFSPIIAENANDFESLDKIDIDRQEYNIENVAPKGFDSGKIMELQSVFKANNNIYINNAFSSVKDPASEDKENSSVNDINKAVESFDQLSLRWENRFKFHLYDDIRCEVPLSFTYDTLYHESALLNLNNYALKLARVSYIDIGLWIDWYAVSFVKLGIRGGRDSHTGNLAVFKNKLYKNANNEQQYGFDLVDYNVIVFGEFLVGNSWINFEPELRCRFEGGYPVIASQKHNDFIFTLEMLAPVKFKFALLDDLSLKLKIDTGMDLPFSGTTSKVEEKYGADGGFGYVSKITTELEYKVLNVFVFRLPLNIGVTGRFAADPAVGDSSSFKAKTVPNLEFNLKLFDQLYLIADAAFEYEFMKISFIPNTVFQFKTSPTLKWGIGFRYDSIY